MKIIAYLYSITTVEYMAKFIDLTGKKFNKLTVIEFIGRKNNHSLFKCKCDCGNESIVYSNNLIRNHTTSCGCFNIYSTINRSTTHNLRKHPLYVSWIGMRNRCYYEKHNRFKNYGGKGIKVFENWKNDFLEFYNWAVNNGWEKGLSIDRIDNNLDYCPTNCKFSTSKEQSRNRTSNIKITVDGETKILIEWAESKNIHYETLRKRLKKGWTDYEIIYGKQKK
jgi:hypothetical protein